MQLESDTEQRTIKNSKEAKRLLVSIYPGDNILNFLRRREIEKPEKNLFKNKELKNPLEKILTSFQTNRGVTTYLYNDKISISVYG